MTTLRITFTAITLLLASSGNSLTASQAQSSSQSSAQPVQSLFSERQTNVTVVNATRAELAATAQTTALATVAATTTPYTGGSTSSTSTGSSRSTSSGSQMSEQERKQIALYEKLERHRRLVTSLAILPNGQLASGSDDHTIKIWEYNEQAIRGKVPSAYYGLGVLCLNGQGVDKNLDKALKLFTQAAQLDDKQAYVQIYNIGICFATGSGVTQDYKKAVSCYEQAIRGKVPSAYYGLGVLYFYGQGVAENLDKALELFTQAAQLGFQDACVLVYHCFTKGIRVQKDEKRAAAYLKIVAENIGEQEAKKRVDERVKLFLSGDPKINCVGEMSACSICMNEFAQGDAITILACGVQSLHIFCKGCLDQWHATRVGQGRPLSCPYCRSTTASVFQGHAF